MTKETDATTVLEKANTLIRKMISVPEVPTPVRTKPSTPTGSPRTLAVKRTEVELEYMQEIAKMNQAIEERLMDLRHAQSSNQQSSNNEDSQEVLRIEGDLKALQVR